MKVSFSPDVILCGWLGLKHQLSVVWKQQWWPHTHTHNRKQEHRKYKGLIPFALWSIATWQLHRILRRGAMLRGSYTECCAVEQCYVAATQNVAPWSNATWQLHRILLLFHRAVKTLCAAAALGMYIFQCAWFLLLSLLLCTYGITFFVCSWFVTSFVCRGWFGWKR